MVRGEARYSQRTHHGDLAALRTENTALAIVPRDILQTWVASIVRACSQRLADSVIYEYEIRYLDQLAILMWKAETYLG